MSISRMRGGEAVRIEMSWSYCAVVEGVVAGSGVIGVGSGGRLRAEGFGGFRLVVGLISLGET